MNAEFLSQYPADADALVLLAYDVEGSLSGSVATQSQETKDFLSQLVQRGELETKRLKVNTFYHVPGIDIPLVIVVGGGRLDEFGAHVAYRAAAIASKNLAGKQRKRVVFDFGPLPRDVARAAVTGSLNGCVGQDLMKADKSLKPFDSIGWVSLDEQHVEWGKIVGQSMLLARELVNLPPNQLYPETFARRAAEVAAADGLELEVWDELRLRRERCGSLLAVAQGSTRPPRLLILRYKGTRDTAPLALVGKGVTFDSGGLSLKPSESMLTMKCDMAGAATVLGTMQAIAQLKLASPVVGLIGLVENMVSGASYKLGDILTARNGKTIEVLNTDAEGRLVLADVLDVAVEQKPSSMIDLATLTGACVVALGTDIAGLMTNNLGFQEQLQRAAETAGEEVWPLPMSSHFSDQVQGKVADLKNVGDGRWGGATTAAKFLEEFVGGVPWVHIDIAGPAFYDNAKNFQDAGGTGVMVRSLVTLVEGES